MNKKSLSKYLSARRRHPGETEKQGSPEGGPFQFRLPPYLPVDTMLHSTWQTLLPAAYDLVLLLCAARTWSNDWSLECCCAALLALLVAMRTYGVLKPPVRTGGAFIQPTALRHPHVLLIIALWAFAERLEIQEGSAADGQMPMRSSSSLAQAWVRHLACWSGLCSGWGVHSDPIYIFMARAVAPFTLNGGTLSTCKEEGIFSSEVIRFTSMEERIQKVSCWVPCMPLLVEPEQYYIAIEGCKDVPGTEHPATGGRATRCTMEHEYMNSFKWGCMAMCMWHASSESYTMWLMVSGSTCVFGTLGVARVLSGRLWNVVSGIWSAAGMLPPAWEALEKLIPRSIMFIATVQVLLAAVPFNWPGWAFAFAGEVAAVLVAFACRAFWRDQRMIVGLAVASLAMRAVLGARYIVMAEMLAMIDVEFTNYYYDPGRGAEAAMVSLWAGMEEGRRRGAAPMTGVDFAYRACEDERIHPVMKLYAILRKTLVFGREWREMSPREAIYLAELVHEWSIKYNRGWRGTLQDMEDMNMFHANETVHDRGVKARSKYLRQASDINHSRYDACHHFRTFCESMNGYLQRDSASPEELLCVKALADYIDERTMCPPIHILERHQPQPLRIQDDGGARGLPGGYPAALDVHPWRGRGAADRHQQEDHAYQDPDPHQRIGGHERVRGNRRRRTELEMLLEGRDVIPGGGRRR